MHGIIETERLILRLPEATDAEPFARLMTDGIARWTGSWKGTITPAEVADKIALYLSTEARGFAINRTAVLKDGGEIIGLIGVRRLDDNPARGAIGYWIGEAWFSRPRHARRRLGRPARRPHRRRGAAAQRRLARGAQGPGHGLRGRARRIRLGARRLGPLRGL
jgi:RimJ/RimL family protein N-acetyltransferase